MAELRELQRKLDSVEALQEIVNAMRNLAAIYVRRAESALSAMRPYADIVATGLRLVLQRLEAVGAEPNDSGPALAVVFAADQGLCGTYNERVTRAAVAFARAAGRPVEFAAVGRRGTELLTLRGNRPLLSLPSPTSLEGIDARIPELAADVFDAYSERGATALFFIYNEYEGMGRFKEKVRPVLPPRLAQLADTGQRAFAYEPLLSAAPEDLLGAFIEEYFFVEFYRALLESHSSENGARLLSMTAASTNIEERLEQVTKEFQTVRQDTITAELLDVVGGAEALRER